MSHPSSAHAPMGRLRALLGNQKVSFLLVGAINLAIGLSWFAFFYLLLGERLGYMATLVLAYIAAILCAFVLHRRFVFKVRGQVWLDLARFSMVQLASLAINAAALPLMIEVAGLPVLPAQLVATAVVVVFNYFGHLLFSFRRHHHDVEVRP